MSSDRDHVLGPQPLGQAHERLVVADDDLGHAVPIANVDEDERAEVAKAVHPAEEDDVLPDVSGRQSATGMGSREGS